MITVEGDIKEIINDPDGDAIMTHCYVIGGYTPEHVPVDIRVYTLQLRDLGEVGEHVQINVTQGHETGRLIA